MPHERQIGSLITRAETQRLVADLYNQGMPIKEIAAQVPVCLATVYRWINLPKHKSIKLKPQPVVIQRIRFALAVVIVRLLYWKLR